MNSLQTAPATLSPKAAQVLAAAKTVFLRDGYEPTSMDAVAREAGVSKATLYAHFAGKEKLFAAVITSECSRHVHMLELIAEEKLPIGEALTRFGTNFLDFLHRPDVIGVFRQVVAESHRQPALGRLFYEAGPTMVQRRLAEFLSRASARGEISAADPEMAAELFLAMVKGQTQLRTELGLPPAPQADRDRLVKAAVDLFLSGVGGA